MRFTRRLRDIRIANWVYFAALFNVFLFLLSFALFLPHLAMPAGFSVMLPHAITSEPVPQKGLIVSILKDNTIYLGPEKVSWDELKRALSLRKDSGFEVLIKTDQAADVGVLIKVWDLLRAQGASKVSIATNG